MTFARAVIEKQLEHFTSTHRERDHINLENQNGAFETRAANGSLRPASENGLKLL